MGRTLSHTVGSRWECLLLLLLGAGQVGRFTFSYCWELSGAKLISPYCGGWVGEICFSPIVGNRSKVAFLILLEVDSGSGKSFFACWELMESQFSHIVGGRVEFLLGGISSLACRAKKTDSTQLENYEKVGIS